MSARAVGLLDKILLLRKDVLQVVFILFDLLSVVLSLVTLD